MANMDEQLWWACCDRDWAQAAFLFEAGAGTEWRGEGFGGATAIMRAAIRGSLETVTLLFNRGANIHARNNKGWNALMYASYSRADIVSYLADKGTDIHVRSNDGEDALLLAAAEGNIDIALDLIARQADARVVNNQNQTALTSFGLGAYPLLSASEKQQGQARLIVAWLAGPHPSQVAERNWQRRKDAVLFLVGSKFRLTAAEKAAAKAEQDQLDKHVKLAGIPRRSKEENLAYLQKEVFGHEGIQRCLVGML